MDDPFVTALKNLVGDSPARRREVAKKIGASEQGLYQIVNGIPLKSGKPRSIGRDLRAKLDQHYPNWLAASGALPSVALQLRETRPTQYAARASSSEQMSKKLAAQLALVPEGQRRHAFAAALAVVATFTADTSTPQDDGRPPAPSEKRNVGGR
jgi:hypothetical protein